MTPLAAIKDMLGERQRQYLEAMGIDTWVPRNDAQTTAGVVQEVIADTPAPAVEPAPAPVTGLKLGPGRDGILLVCAGDSEPASRLATDIARALGSVPVWAWPGVDSDAVPVGDAVAENLFTTIAVFGEELAAGLFEGEAPASVGAASLVLLPSMQDLRQHASARRALWNALCRAGMVSIARQ